MATTTRVSRGEPSTSKLLSIAFRRNHLAPQCGIAGGGLTLLSPTIIGTRRTDRTHEADVGTCAAGCRGQTLRDARCSASLCTQRCFSRRDGGGGPSSFPGRVKAREDAADLVWRQQCGRHGPELRQILSAAHYLPRDLAVECVRSH